MSSAELPGHLLGRSIRDRVALLAPAPRWSTLPEELKLAILDVAGIDAQNLKFRRESYQCAAMTFPLLNQTWNHWPSLSLYK